LREIHLKKTDCFNVIFSYWVYF